ncbi:MAG: cyclopropane-fatty-acyl-phospholipid synthase family protein [Pseudomonadota bacterium]|nr:cyclopropane-fatty-acyl-phospholipid synthase family protein [Pseudomonadota bacterium]
MSFFYRMISKIILKKLLINFRGNLVIIFPNESRFILGKGNGTPYFKITNNFFLIRLLINGVSAIGYGYYKGEWITNNLSYVVKLGLKNINTIKSLKIKQQFFYQIKKLFGLESSNTIKKSKKQISFHYDLGNLFYSFWLDKSMTYSSAIFNKKNISLERAQDNKYKSLVKLAKINKQNKVLEIGCGWGGFTGYVSKKIGANITGITISENQYNYATNLQQKNVSIKFLDYRKIEKKYDKIVSIEMFEAVGKKNWDTFFKVINRSLKQNGVAVLQIITINEKLYEYYSINKDFIQKYIFPGGMLPTKNIIYNLANTNNLSITFEKSLGQDYAKTLNIWKKNFLLRWRSLEEIGFKKDFKRLWEFYLTYCEEGFKANTINVYQFLLKKNK